MIVTVTFKVAVAVRLPSLTCKVKLALDAAQLATMSAVIVPLVLTMLDSVTPLDGLALVTVTARLPATVSLSLTVAMVELEAGEPCCRVTPEAAAMVGDVLAGAVTSSEPMSGVEGSRVSLS